jgi:hypothetical protein
MSAVPLFDPDPFPCPGCGRRDGAHPPLCQVAVRLTAARAAAGGDGWRAKLLAASLALADLYGCRWYPAVRHYRAAAADDPPADDPGEPLAYAPADDLFRLVPD